MESPHGPDYILSMNRSTAGLAAAILLILISALDASADSLWDQVLNHTSPDNVEQVLAMTISSHEKNRRGEITKTTHLEFVWDFAADDFILLSATEDGKDVSGRERRRAERRDGDDRGPYAHQMFNPEKSDRLIIFPRDITAIVGGRDCRIYDFRFEDEWPMGPGKPKPVVEEGVLLVDLESGMPLRLTSSIAEGPNAIKSFNYVMDAGPGPTGLWRVADVEMEFIGQMIVYIAGGFTMSFKYGS